MKFFNRLTERQMVKHNGGTTFFQITCFVRRQDGRGWQKVCPIRVYNDTK